jgi:hypothetical protein
MASSMQSPDHIECGQPSANRCEATIARRLFFPGDNCV